MPDNDYIDHLNEAMKNPKLPSEEGLAVIAPDRRTIEGWIKAVKDIGDYKWFAIAMACQKGTMAVEDCTTEEMWHKFGEVLLFLMQLLPPDDATIFFDPEVGNDLEKFGFQTLEFPPDCDTEAWPTINGLPIIPFLNQAYGNRTLPDKKDFLNYLFIGHRLEHDITWMLSTTGGTESDAALKRIQKVVKHLLTLKPS